MSFAHAHSHAYLCLPPGSHVHAHIRTHTHPYVQTLTYSMLSHTRTAPQPPRLIDNHTPPQSPSFTCPPAPVPFPTPPLGHTQRPPLWGHAPRPGAFSASHLAHSFHILSLPHSLSRSDSFSIQPSDLQPATALGRELSPGPWAPPQPGHHVDSPLLSGIRCSHSLLHLRLPLFPLRSRQTDRQTDTCTHTLTPTPPLQQPHGSSLFLIMGQCACLLTQLEMVRE